MGVVSIKVAVVLLRRGAVFFWDNGGRLLIRDGGDIFEVAGLVGTAYDMYQFAGWLNDHRANPDLVYTVLVDAEAGRIGGITPASMDTHGPGEGYEPGPEGGGGEDGGGGGSGCVTLAVTLAGQLRADEPRRE